MSKYFKCKICSNPVEANEDYCMDCKSEYTYKYCVDCGKEIFVKHHEGWCTECCKRKKKEREEKEHKKWL